MSSSMARFIALADRPADFRAGVEWFTARPRGFAHPLPVARSWATQRGTHIMVTRTLQFGKNDWPNATDYPGENNNAADDITGTSAPNVIDLGNGNDKVDAKAGDDTVTPGRGSDTVTLGDGVDTVVYTSVLDSPASSPDTLVDFKSGVDLLDLKQVDANITVAGDQDFNFIFSKAFSGVAAELRVDQITGRLEGDVDGDKTADLVIQFGAELPTGGGQINTLVPQGEEAPAVDMGGQFGDFIL
jgi:hypothetical protein